MNSQVDDQEGLYLKHELYRLIQSDERVFDFLQKGSLDGVWYWDLENPDHEWMSEEFWQLLGFDPDTKLHLAKEWQDLIFPEDLEVAIANFDAHCQNPNHPYDQVVRYKHKHGHTVWVRCRGIAIRDENGTPIRMLGVHTDLTDRMNAEEKLSSINQDLLELSNTAIEAAPTAILVVRQNGEIELVNKQAELLFGYNRSDMLNQKIDLLLPSRVRSIHSNFLDSFFKAPSFRPMGEGRNLTGLHKSGKEIPIEIGLNPFLTNEGMKVIASITDITQRLAHEREINRYTRDLERSNRELDEFAYIASHDLKAPLRGIKQLSDLIEMDIQVPEDSEVGEYLSLMRGRIGRMERLLNDLLAYSRIGKMSTDLRVVNVAESAKDLFDILAPSEGFSLECADDLPIFETLEAPFELVLRNLFSNAIKHHDKDTGRITLTYSQTDTHHIFQVADDGPGIPPEYHEKVFAIFQTLRPRDEMEASGMGLTSVKKALDNLGCDISIHSDGMRGTRFEFSWPNKDTIQRRLE